MTAERTHLSIGEVLSLLQPEFPDITISKIRFLESQGLLDPERTPSGYRKFHDDDIERLRWILTQQRDHFLPLKVIKDRLASGDLGNGSAEGVLPLAAGTPAAGDVVPAWAPTAPPPGSTPDGAADAAEAATPEAAEAVVEAASNGASEPEPTEETTEPEESPTSSRKGAAEKPSVPEESAAPAAAAGHDRAEAVGRIVEAPEEPTPEPEPEPEPLADASEATDGADDAAGAEPAATATGGKGRRRHPTGHQPGEPTPDADGESAAETDTDAPADALTLDQLVERSGLSARDVVELERFGLIAGYDDGPETTYDEEALVVARLAVGFSRYGIEPRHLRMYKVAAEREAGLFEQLISPLLKQRRPSARQQAVEMLEDLAELADDLRAAMVRTALREYLGGS